MWGEGHGIYVRHKVCDAEEPDLDIHHEASYVDTHKAQDTRRAWKDTRERSRR